MEIIAVSSPGPAIGWRALGVASSSTDDLSIKKACFADQIFDSFVKGVPLCFWGNSQLLWCLPYCIQLGLQVVAEQQSCHASVNSSFAHPLPGNRGAFAHVVSPGVGHLQFYRGPGPGICVPRGNPQAFDNNLWCEHDYFAIHIQI